ncbi:MAG TPA: fibronectin type III domain-containing protein, partial [Candidatus Dormibacteraeota bacterium]|nr:fibronectin type III domain-containing protein [Candidatus Dormibacteraeota bacterium]
MFAILNLLFASPLQAGKPTPPLAPSNLTATVASSSQINLKWRDNSANESGFIIQRSLSSSGPWSQIGTVGVNITNYASGGLSAGTTYSYRVCAYNSRGSSAYSSVASATTSQSVLVDTTAPSIPSGLTAAAASSSQINLSWSAATDTGGSGLAGYKVYRSGVQIGTTTTTSYSNPGLAASTTYSYTVAAYDVAGNTSGQSAQASATTQAAPDTTAPSVPAGLTATAVTASQINLSWGAATDTGGSGLAGYKVYRDGVQIGTTTTTSYSNPGLAA